MFREYLMGQSLEVVVRNINVPCDDLCEIPWFQVTSIPLSSRPPLKYHAQLIHVPIDFNTPQTLVRFQFSAAFLPCPFHQRESLCC